MNCSMFLDSDGSKFVTNKDQCYIIIYGLLSIDKPIVYFWFCQKNPESGVISPSMISSVKSDSMLITWMQFVFLKVIVWFCLNKPDNSIMVTGTNGKTSVVKYIWHI